MSNHIARAFERSDYHVDTAKQRYTLSIGQPYPVSFLPWLRKHCRSHCAWIITAHNPAAQRLAADENERRHAALAACLQAYACAYAPAANTAVDDDWPQEPGFLLLGGDEGLARALARRFGQMALVAVPVTGTAQLVWLDA